MPSAEACKLKTTIHAATLKKLASTIGALMKNGEKDKAEETKRESGILSKRRLPAESRDKKSAKMK